ncbi:hypothetical protein H1C71_018522 [Ictidomys tridecemlineatus]|nr:hypothetical protein H1C71_018522 [Ictidomys tridecemlineatus]
MWDSWPPDSSSFPSAGRHQVSRPASTPGVTPSLHTTEAQTRLALKHLWILWASPPSLLCVVCGTFLSSQVTCSSVSHLIGVGSSEASQAPAPSSSFFPGHRD